MVRPQGEMESGEIDRLEQAVLARIEQGTLRVPPYPTVAIALRKLVGEANYGLQQVLAIVSTDAALVADVLRCANAAFFGRGTVSSLQQAVTRVGGAQVTRLAIVSGLSGIARAAGPLAALRRQAWETGLTCAAICQLLAPLRKISSESAFVAGLLHDFGWLVGISAMEELLAESPDIPARDEPFWNEALERCHAKLGLALAAKWNLPDLLRDAIGLHHSGPGESEFPDFVELVMVSDRVAALMKDHPHVSAEQLAQVPQLSPEERKVLAPALPQLPELVAAFECEPQGSPARSKLLEPAAKRLGATSAKQLPSGFSALDCKVFQVSPRKRGPYEMLGIGEGGILMKGRQELPDKQLVELELMSVGTPLRLWAKVALSASEPDGFRFQCKPFALTGDGLKRWQLLLQKS